MDPEALSCPKCGAPLGPHDGSGERTCAYCGQRVARVKSSSDGGVAQWMEAERQRELARSQTNDRRAHGMAEAMERKRFSIEGSRRTEGIILASVGAVFVVFAIVCFVIAVPLLMTDVPVVAAFPAVFGLFWAALATLMLVLGLRRVRMARQNEQLMTSGITGEATVLSYSESDMRIDGQNIFHVVLRVTIPGQPPWEVSRSGERVPRGKLVYADMSVPVLVDPQNPTEMLIDWT